MRTKEDCIQSIRSRILSEFGKHKDLDWAEIAAHKIYSEFVVIPRKSCSDYAGLGMCRVHNSKGVASCDGCPINGGVQV